jgi:hypothetical protein
MHFQKDNSTVQVPVCWRKKGSVALPITSIGIVQPGEFIQFPDEEPRYVKSVIVRPVECVLHDAEGLQYDDGTDHVILDTAHLNNFQFLKWKAKQMGLQLLGCVNASGK